MIDLAVFTNILQFVFVKTKRSRAGLPFSRKWAPFNLILLSTFLSMADLMRHLVNDAWGTACTSLEAGEQLAIGSAHGPWVPLNNGAHTYSKYCYSRDVASEFSETGWWGLSAWGWTTTIFCTYMGFILLFVGICWIINLPTKVMSQWRAVRQGQRQQPPTDTARAAALLA